MMQNVPIHQTVSSIVGYRTILLCDAISRKMAGSVYVLYSKM